MLRIASAVYALFAVLLISTSLLPSSSAEAGYYGTRYGVVRGGATYSPYGAVVYGQRRVAVLPYVGDGYRGVYGHRAGYGDGSFVTAPYYVNGCHNGYSDGGVYCYVYFGCP